MPIVYSYEDAVKLAGHSCPPVSGGFKLVQIALEQLYPDAIPVRGDIKVKVLGGSECKVNSAIWPLTFRCAGPRWPAYAVLAAAQQVLVPFYDGLELREGQMRLTVVSSREPAGKPLREMKKVGVVLTIDGGLEDLEIQERFDLRGVRRARLLRICEEAIDQGGVLTQEDLSRVLKTGVRTIRRDVAALREAGYRVPTRGAVAEMGRGQSHKAKIVELYLCRQTYTEIMTGYRPERAATLEDDLRVEKP